MGTRRLRGTEVTVPSQSLFPYCGAAGVRSWIVLCGGAVLGFVRYLAASLAFIY